MQSVTKLFTCIPFFKLVPVSIYELSRMSYGYDIKKLRVLLN
jgi:hypothetical protein